MGGSGGDGGVLAVGSVCLSVGIVAPAGDGVVGCDGARVGGAGGDGGGGDGGVFTTGCFGLPLVEIAVVFVEMVREPTFDCLVGLDGARVVTARGDGGELSVGRIYRLPGHLLTPTFDCLVGLNGTGVEKVGGDGGVLAVGRVCPPVSVVAPTDDCAVGFDGAGVGLGDGDGGGGDGSVRVGVGIFLGWESSRGVFELDPPVAAGRDVVCGVGSVVSSGRVEACCCAGVEWSGGH